MKKETDKRLSIIKPYIKDKNVLDLGPGDTRDRQLHTFLHHHAKKSIGIEIDKERAKKLKDKGYNIIVSDAQDFDVDENFDVVVAGDLIEHLTNFQGFFNSIKKHMKKDAVLILNTPNVFSFYVLSGLQRKPFQEHTCWFCEHTLNQLVSRFGLKIVEKYFYTNDYGTLKGKIIQQIFILKPKLNSNILAICKKNGFA